MCEIGLPEEVVSFASLLLFACSVVLPPGSILMEGVDVEVGTLDTYTVEKKDQFVGAEFEYSTQSGEIVGHGSKKALSIRTCYDLHNSAGLYEGYGARAFSLARSERWASIDIYDAQNRVVGSIRGEPDAERPEFYFYDGQGKEIGRGVVDRTYTNFCITPPGGVGKLPAMLAFLRFNEDGHDHAAEWEVFVYAGSIHPLMIKVFSAFIADRFDQLKQEWGDSGEIAKARGLVRKLQQSATSSSASRRGCGAPSVLLYGYPY